MVLQPYIIIQKENKILKYIIKHSVSHDKNDSIGVYLYRYILFLSIVLFIAFVIFNNSGIGIFDEVVVVSYVVLFVDYILRVLAVWIQIDTANSDENNKITVGKYIFSFYGIIDFFTAMAFVLYLSSIKQGDIYLLLSLVSMLKFTRYSPALVILKDVFINERKTLLASLYVMIIMTFSTSVILYLLERDINDGFSTLLSSIWWSVVTLATVGYGDIVPITGVGKLFGALSSISGFGMFALPAGILANGFASEIKRLRDSVNWQLVKKVPLFSQLESGVIYEIADMLKVKRFSKNDTIIQQGDYGDSMYFVSEGEVKVLIKDVDVILRSGDFFGEISMIEDIPRTATVIAKTRCELLKLNRYNFQNFIHSKPDILKQIKEVEASRYGK